MDHVKEFLDNSTIHGLSFISSTRRWSRLFWILVVIGGFSGAGYMIYTSFHNWGQSPITTTIETLPISELTLPNVTVCPPKNSLLNLNYDIVHSDEMKLDNDTRKELFDFALDVVQEKFSEETIRNLSKIQDPNKYYNWYHGYTLLQYPYHKYEDNQLQYFVLTTATSGNLTTEHFGEKFDATMVDSNIITKINVYVPPSVQGVTSIKLFFNLEKNTMKEVSDNDKMTITTVGDIDGDKSHVTNNITGPFKHEYYSIRLNRDVKDEDIKNIKQDKMPGFRFTWKYDKEVPLWSKFKNWNNQFTRSAIFNCYLNKII